MKYAIFSDIHGNLESLQIFMDWLLHRPELKPVCLGDVIGYGAHPNECVARLAENHIPCVMGNHEYALNFLQERKNINEYALRAMEWYDQVLSSDHREILRRLPLSMVIDQQLAVTHADFSDPAGFVYINSVCDARDSMAALPGVLGFYGHTHMPGIFVEDPAKPAGDRITWHGGESDGEPFRLDPACRYLINPGSLGQPRDGDPRAAFAVLDSEEQTVTFHRLVYNWEAEARAIREAGLPEFLAERLLVGY
ncbi:MAG TPA: metallophosphoesterase family protein [bacterium]|nr:metallophosphoesterase family protein [Candidatus Omnitrophota bacterium]HOL93277.1 metallophosphoesterase family protein [bacterium]HPP01324.1 metallophosphoesterase family protein [bacterium]HXK92317.1 metallophosphoesterase family protein [bacterium]